MIVHVYGNPLTSSDPGHLRSPLADFVEDCWKPRRQIRRQSGWKFRPIDIQLHFSHHITTLEGGITVAQTQDDAELMRILRAHGWIREVEDQKPWIERYPDIHRDFLVNLGYNLRATELQGDGFRTTEATRYVEARRQNAEILASQLQTNAPLLQTQSTTPQGEHSWFGFPITLGIAAPFSVDDIMTALGDVGIETRPIICGNIARQPGLKLYPHRTQGDLTASAAGTRVFGNHQDIDNAARILGAIMSLPIKVFFPLT